MKRGKYEEKMGPMFPRLHVNDTEKGGPKAPPRNKMALYEQLSIPSQRFSPPILPLNSNSDPPPSTQEAPNEGGIFFSYQLPPQQQSEKLYTRYSDFSIPLKQVNQRNKLDDDDFRVPIFIHSLPSQECGNYANDLNKEKLSTSFHPDSPIKFMKKKRVLESSMRQEGESQKDGISEERATDRVKDVSPSTIEKAEGLKEQPYSSACHTPRDNPANIAALGERNAVAPVMASRSGDQEIFHSRRNEMGSEDRSFRSVPMTNIERRDSVSETSIIVDVTPDDVVGMMGQKHFWKARKAILHQQKVFAVQIFELHRLVEVQRLIAESPQLLVDNSAYLDKSMKVLPRAKIPSTSSAKASPNVSKQKGEPEKQSQTKESSAENNVGKASFSSIQNSVLPSSCKLLTSNSRAPSATSNENTQPWGFNQPQGQQWLIPVMSPSEGLVYKPYPGPSFAGPTCGPPGPNPVMGGVLTLAYGVPAPSHPQYPLPSFPQATPHSYFPTYGMPIMNPTAFSGSSVEQTNQTQTSAGEANVANQRQNSSNRASSDEPGDIELQASTPSSPVERSQDNIGSSTTERTNVLPLFPMVPAIDSPNISPRRSELERPAQVIKVVPHNAISATESAARIFRSIQEERKQYDSV